MRGGILILFVAAVLVSRKASVSIFKYAFLYSATAAYTTRTYSWILVKLAYYLGVIIISISLMLITSDKKIFLLSKIGSRTMQIYFWHIPLRSLLASIGLQDAFGYNMVGKAGWIVFSALITIILSLKPFGFPTNFILKGVKKVEQRL